MKIFSDEIVNYLISRICERDELGGKKLRTKREEMKCYSLRIGSWLFSVAGHKQLVLHMRNRSSSFEFFSCCEAIPRIQTSLYNALTQLGAVGLEVHLLQTDTIEETEWRKH